MKRKVLFVIIAIIINCNYVNAQTTKLQNDTISGLPSTLLDSSTKESKKQFIPNNNYLNLGIGGGLRGFAIGLAYFYSFIGIGIRDVPGNAPSEVSNCSLCFATRHTLPYDVVTRKYYKKELVDFNLQFKIPIINRIYLTISGGYYQDIWVEVTTYLDDIYPKEVRWGNEEVRESGFSIGGGVIYDISNIFSLALEFSKPAGGMFYFCLTF